MNSEACCQTKPVLHCHPLRLTWLSANYAARRSASSMQIELQIAQVTEERVRSVHGNALGGAATVMELLACELDFAAQELNESGIERLDLLGDDRLRSVAG